MTQPDDTPRDTAHEAEPTPNDDAARADSAGDTSTDTDSESERRSVTDELKATARKVWLAGLGALSVAEAEGTRVFNKLVENGEDFERRNRPKVDEMKARAERAREKASDKIRSLEKKVENAVSSKLQGAGMAAQEQVDELRARIADLEAALSRMTGSDDDAESTDDAASGDAASGDTPSGSAPSGNASSEAAAGADAPRPDATTGSDTGGDAPPPASDAGSNDPDDDRPV